MSEQINERKLKKLLNDCRIADAAKANITGGINEKIGEAVEHDYLIKKAFKVVRMLQRCENEELAIVLPALLYYIDASGLSERAASAPPLPMGDEEEKEAGEPEHAAA